MELVKKKRNTNIEILRVIGMLMIFFHHMYYHGGVSGYGGETFNGFVQHLMFNGGKVGITIFVFISGYYLIDATFSWKRVVRFLIELLIFSLAFFIMHMCLTPEEVTVKLIYQQFTPFLSDTYWFVTTYILLYVLSPILNAGLKHISKYTHLSIAIFLLVVFSVFPSFFLKGTNFSTFAWFIVVYIIASYFKLYSVSFFKKHNYINLIISVSLYVGVSLITFYAYKLPFLKDYPLNLTGMNATFMVLFTIFSFEFFVNLPSFSSKWLNLLFSGVLEVYLIHENPYFRDVLYHKIMFSNKIPLDAYWWIKYFGLGLLSFIVILLCGSLISYALNKSVFRLVDYCSLKISDKINERRKITVETKEE